MAAPIRILVDDALRMFLSRARRSGDVLVNQDGTSSLGHLVQSIGVPLPEVGQLVVGGTPVPPTRRPQVGTVVRVRGVTRPQPLPTRPARFVLDVHLGSLARRLRLLGIDASYDRQADDDDLVEISLAQARVLLTKDRGLLSRKTLRDAAFVRGSTGDEQLRDVLDRFAPGLAPFTRCTACNGELRHVPKAAIVSSLEPGTARSYDEFSQCGACGHLYWRGAHARRLDPLVALATAASAVRGGTCA